MASPIGNTSYLKCGLPKYGSIPQNSLASGVRDKLWKASLRSTQLNTSHWALPNIMKISLSNGVEVFLLTILVFNSLKLMTGLFLSFPFLATNMTGEVWVVLFLVRIPRETNFCTHLSMRRLSSSAMGKGLTKKVEESLTSMFTFMSGHFSYLIPNAKSFLVGNYEIHYLFFFLVC